MLRRTISLRVKYFFKRKTCEPNEVRGSNLLKIFCSVTSFLYCIMKELDKAIIMWQVVWISFTFPLKYVRNFIMVPSTKYITLNMPNIWPPHAFYQKNDVTTTVDVHFWLAPLPRFLCTYFMDGPYLHQVKVFVNVTIKFRLTAAQPYKFIKYFFFKKICNFCQKGFDN